MAAPIRNLPKAAIEIDPSSLWRDASPLVITGSIVFLMFFGVFIGWASVAPLYGAAISTGVVSVESNRKKIQHLEGGIISEILVSDGDSVSKGQVLVRLSETQSRASLDLLKWRRTVSTSEAARLVAERQQITLFDIGSIERDGADPSKFAEIIANQSNIFTSNRDAMIGQTAILQQRVGELENEIDGLKAQIEAEKIQLQLIGQEIEDIGSLVAKGLAPKPRLLALQRTRADLDGSIGKNRAFIARARQTIGATNLQKEELVLENRRRIAGELKTVQSDLLDLEEKIRSAEDVQARIEIRAPLDGVVVNKQVFTTGGVLSPGQMVMEIVPRGDRLIVEAMVKPGDIDEVSIGQTARVRFSAFSQRRSRPIDGRVISVSADRLVDERTGAGYFLARIELDEEAVEALGAGALTPGMQAEVFVVTKTRTLMSYLLEPLTQGLERGLRE